MEGVVKFSPRPTSHRARGRGSGRKAYSSTPTSKSKLHLILRVIAPVGGGDGVLSKLLLILQVDGTHQKYSSV